MEEIPFGKEIGELTPRETEILYWKLKGRLRKEIAEELYIELSTVQKHLNHIYTKLGFDPKATYAERHVILRDKVYPSFMKTVSSVRRLRFRRRR